MIVRIIRYLLGYTKITVTGGFAERLLNLCMLRKISVWGVSRDKDGRLSFYTDKGNLDEIQEAATDAYTVIKVSGRYGMPYVAHRYRKRYMLLAGPVMAALFLGVASLFVWNIDVTGNESTSTQTIIDALEKNGFAIGTYKRGVDYSMLSEKVLIDVNSLVWVSINVKGTHALVEVHERNMPPDIVDRYTVSDIIAKKDGLITYIAPFSGTALVRAGDSVSSGQTLISGEIVYVDGSAAPCAAYGEVDAKTWYTFVYECPPEVYKDTYTGRQKKFVTLNVFNKKIKLFNKSSISYGEYDNIIKTKQLCLFGDLYLPFSVTVDCYREKGRTLQALTREEQTLISRDELKKALRAEIGDGKITVKTFKEKEDGDTLITYLEAECLEDIGKRVPIV